MWEVPAAIRRVEEVSVDVDWQCTGLSSAKLWAGMMDVGVKE